MRNGFDGRRRAVVTGGAGFLGSHLCDTLVAADYHVTCIDNLETGKRINVEQLREIPQFRFIEGDVSEGLELAEPIDIIYHFAAPTTPSDYLLDPVETMRMASQGTWNALDLARSRQARFVLASTSEVYGPPGSGPTHEDDTGNVNPVTTYGAYYECRRFSEALTATYRMTYNVRTAIARIFSTYGPRMRLDDGRILARFLRQALSGAPLTVPVSGSRTRSMCYVDDVVAALTTLADGSYPGPVNIGSPEEMSLFSIAKHVQEAIGPESQITFVDTPTDDSAGRSPDIRMAAELLDWQPQTSMTKGLAATVAWFERVGTSRV